MKTPFFDYSPIKIGNFDIGSKYIHFGMTKIDDIVSPNYIGWCGVTMSPCSSNNDKFLEYPDIALNYYKERLVDSVIIESKHMGSRICIYFDKNVESLCCYSRGLFKINFDEDILNKIFNDCVKFCDIYKIDGFIIDGELEPWKYLSGKSINYDFKFPIESYYLDNGNTENYEKTKNVIDFFSKESDLKIHIFDVPAIKHNNEWMEMKFIVEPNKIYENDFNIFTRVDYHVKIDNLQDINDYVIEDICNFFEKITVFRNNKIYEGIVIKLYDRQIDSNYILPPYIKCRGKDYLRIIYGVDYDDVYIDKLRKRNLKRKRMQSFMEYSVNLMIYKTWIEYKNSKDSNLYKTLLKYIAAYLGLREYGYYKIDKTL